MRVWRRSLAMIPVFIAARKGYFEFDIRGVNARAKLHQLAGAITGIDLNGFDPNPDDPFLQGGSNKLRAIVRSYVCGLAMQQ